MSSLTVKFVGCCLLQFGIWVFACVLHFQACIVVIVLATVLSTSLQNSSRRLRQLRRIGNSKNCRNCRWLKLLPAIRTVTFVLVVLKMFLTQTACGRRLPFITSAVYEPTLFPFHVFRKSEQSKSVLRFILTVRGHCSQPLSQSHLQKKTIYNFAKQLQR